MSERGCRAGELLLDSCAVTRGGWELAQSGWDGPCSKAQRALSGVCVSWGECIGALQGPWGPGRCLELDREKEEY